MAAINRYTQGVQNTLEEYVPLPMQQLMQAASLIQQRGDLAQEQMQQTEMGLASIEALAPAYAQYKDKFVGDYQKRAGELLEKFQGNTSNPEFMRAIKQLNTTALSDPRLQTIKQGNEYIKSQQKYQQELDMKGVKYINPLKNFTGLDSEGRLTTPSGSIRQVNFDDEIAKTFEKAGENIVENGNGLETNRPNLNATAKSLLNNLEGNPTTRDAIEWYQSQGFTPEQARQKTIQLIDQSYSNNLKEKKNWERDRMIQSANQFNMQFRANREDAAFDKQYKLAQLGIAQDKAGAAAREKAAKGDPSGLLRQQVVANGRKAINTIVGDQKVLTTHTSARNVEGDVAKRTLRNAYKIDKEGKNHRGPVTDQAMKPTQDVLVYLDSKGNIVTGNKDRGGVFNASNKSYRQTGDKEARTNLKPVAMREYVDPKGNRYYEPLNYQETILSGFDPAQNIDFKPLINGIDKLTTDSYDKVGTNKAGGKNFDLKGSKKLSINTDLLSQADGLLQRAGIGSIKDLPDYKRTKQLIERFNSGKKIAKVDYDFIQNFNNDLTETVYEEINKSTIYPYLSGKSAQTEIAKQFMSPFVNSSTDLTTKQIEAEEKED